MIQQLTEKISFIGFGDLARALVEGALRAEALKPEMLTVTSPSLIAGRKNTPFHLAMTNLQAAEHADVIVLAVKPSQIEMVCQEIVDVVREDQIIISVAAGKTVSKIENYLACRTASIVRAMPNTAVAVEAGVTALYYHPAFKKSKRNFVQDFFQSTGTVIEVDKEEDLDLFTAISGSGPAYFFYFQEALMHAASRLGLSQEIAQILVKQTMHGASLLTQNSSSATFQEKRAEVTSPGGTTAAAISYLEKHHFLELIDQMVEKAYLRARELG
jgi:pyrroline-5-carboxylate reductase